MCKVHLWGAMEDVGAQVLNCQSKCRVDENYSPCLDATVIIRACLPNKQKETEKIKAT